MRRFNPITILGQDGTGPMPELADIWRIVIPEAQVQFPDFDIAILDPNRNRKHSEPLHPHDEWCTNRVIERMFAWFAATEHNDLVPHLNRLNDLHADCPHLIEQANHLYDDLEKNTTINWLASHHRFVKSTLRARALLTEQAELTAELAARTPGILKKGTMPIRTCYTKNVPQAERIQLPTQADADRAQTTLDNFVTASIHRFEILRATLTGSYPPGFEPAPLETPTELTDADIPISPALAYADQAMRIPGPRPGDPDAHVRSW